MIEPAEALASKFVDSHLYDKLRSMIVVSRIFENVAETSSLLHAAAEFDLDDAATCAEVKRDYETQSQIQCNQGAIRARCPPCSQAKPLAQPEAHCNFSAPAGLIGADGTVDFRAHLSGDHQGDHFVVAEEGP
jgi:hypothetical protein